MPSLKTYMMWHGGASYAAPYPEDTEEFNSLREALDAFDRRAHQSETYYPCVSEDTPEMGGPESWLFFSDPREMGGDVYPDRIVSFGPRGGIRVRSA